MPVRETRVFLPGRPKMQALPFFWFRSLRRRVLSQRASRLQALQHAFGHSHPMLMPLAILGAECCCKRITAAAQATFPYLRRFDMGNQPRKVPPCLNESEAGSTHSISGTCRSGQPTSTWPRQGRQAVLAAMEGVERTMKQGTDD